MARDFDPEEDDDDGPEQDVLAELTVQLVDLIAAEVAASERRTEAAIRTTQGGPQLDAVVRGAARVAIATDLSEALVIEARAREEAIRASAALADAASSALGSRVIAVEMGTSSAIETSQAAAEMARTAEATAQAAEAAAAGAEATSAATQADVAASLAVPAGMTAVRWFGGAWAKRSYPEGSLVQESGALWLAVRPSTQNDTPGYASKVWSMVASAAMSSFSSVGAGRAIRGAAASEVFFQDTAPDPNPGNLLPQGSTKHARVWFDTSSWGQFSAIEDGAGGWIWTQVKGFGSTATGGGGTPLPPAIPDAVLGTDAAATTQWQTVLSGGTF